MFKRRIRRQKFTADEDVKLKHLVMRFGTKCWEEVARYMPGRNGRQCRDRYQNYLIENFKKGGWTEEEDEFVIKKYFEIGPHWVEIAKGLKGRSGNNVKNRWHKFLIKQVNVQINNSQTFPELSDSAESDSSDHEIQKQTEIKPKGDGDLMDLFEVFDSQITMMTFFPNEQAQSREFMFNQTIF